MPEPKACSRWGLKRAERLSGDLQELVSAFAPAEPEMIILFGSRARGEANKYSDYDVIVIEQTDKPFVERLTDMVP